MEFHNFEIHRNQAARRQQAAGIVACASDRRGAGDRSPGAEAPSCGIGEPCATTTMRWSLRHLTAGELARVERPDVHGSLDRIKRRGRYVPSIQLRAAGRRATPASATLRRRKAKLLGIERVRPRTRQPRQPRSGATVFGICGPTVAPADDFVAMQQQFPWEVQSAPQAEVSCGRRAMAWPSLGWEKASPAANFVASVEAVTPPQ